MDSQLFRLNQMSYQHHQAVLQQQHQQHQRAARQHYSTRQQAGAVSAASSQQAKGHPQQLVAGAAAAAASGATTNSSLVSSGSDQDDQVQLSSLSTATNKTLSSANSQAAILGGQHAQRHQRESQMQREQHMMAAAKQRHMQAHGHRQAALQAHTLTAPGHHNGKQGADRAHHQKLAASSSDQLTTSSDQTIDDLHQLAPHQHQHHFGHNNHNHNHNSSSAASSAAALHHSHHHSHHSHHRAGGPPAASSSSQSGSRFLLGVLFTFAELLLFASVLLWLYWAYQHDDGLAWQSDRKQQFNTHAALMLFGFIFLSGQAMLIHRSFSCCSKIYTKILHTILFVLATSAISLGLILAYTAQENVGANNKPIMHFYSLHAWCGLTTVALFALQFVFGFVSFLILLCCDQATAGFRAALLPIHKTFGLIIFSLAVATCLMGLLQTARSRLSAKLNKTDYHELAEPGIIINLMGVCLIALAILMPYIIRNLDIKRAPTFRSQLDRHLNKLSQLDMRI